MKELQNVLCHFSIFTPVHAAFLHPDLLPSCFPFLWNTGGAIGTSCTMEMEQCDSLRLISCLNYRLWHIACFSSIIWAVRFISSPPSRSSSCLRWRDNITLLGRKYYHQNLQKIWICGCRALKVETTTLSPHLHLINGRDPVFAHAPDYLKMSAPAFVRPSFLLTKPITIKIFITNYPI